MAGVKSNLLETVFGENSQILKINYAIPPDSFDLPS
jgi:hypothetical protein